MFDIAKPPRVAVIDDDEGFARSMAVLLGSAGFDVRLFHSAESFIAADETQRFGCLIVDWLLPGMDGATLCAQLARMDRHPALMLVSGTQFHDDGPPDGMSSRVAFAQKPFDPDWLLRKVSDLCR